jgi:riboflavin kinase/FMN adenylyltransferase
VCSQRVFGADNLEPCAQGSLVAIGNFDGVHRGHRSVLTQALSGARAGNLQPLVLTFDPHPAAVVGRGLLPALTSLDRKLELLCRQAPELKVVVEPFTPALAATSPAEFVAELLVGKLRARAVLVGENFRFGRERQGDFGLLQQLGLQHGFRALAAQLESDAGGPISSTRVRSELALGRLAEVESLLGRPHSVCGRVHRGDGRGRSIGVPTANLTDVREAVPPHGVYAVLVDRQGEGGSARLAGGVANYGIRPTVGAGPSFEAHLFDFASDLYGQELRVHLVARLRDERKFSGIDELRDQIARDIQAARTILAARNPDPSALGAWY